MSDGTQLRHANRCGVVSWIWAVSGGTGAWSSVLEYQSRPGPTRENMSGKQRANGEGTICRRKSDGRWCATFVAGYDESGRPRRRTVYGSSQGEAVEKLRTAQRQHASGTLPAASALKVGEWLDQWLEDVRTAEPVNDFEKPTCWI